MIEVEDRDWKADSLGMAGEEVTLQLLMRLVADVGFVGLPNAGKSSLLSRLTRQVKLENHPSLHMRRI